MNELILVVDDEPKIVKLARDYLERSNFQVISADDGVTALAMARHERPDLIVLDLNLPGMDGLDVCRALRRESDVPIIMLTARSEEPEVLRGFAGGADDYVSKPFSFAQLVARVRAVLDRAGRTSDAGPAVLRGGDLEVDVDRHRVFRAGEPIDLTATEFKILEALLREKGKVLSTRDLVTEVWGSEYAEETGYVRRYVWHLRRKLEPDPQHPRYILNERSFGYVFPADT